MQIISLTQLFFSLYWCFVDSSHTASTALFPCSPVSFPHVPHISPCPSHFPMSITFPHVPHISPCRSHVPMSLMSPCPPCPSCPHVPHVPHISPTFVPISPYLGRVLFPKHLSHVHTLCPHFSCDLDSGRRPKKIFDLYHLPSTSHHFPPTITLGQFWHQLLIRPKMGRYFKFRKTREVSSEREIPIRMSHYLGCLSKPAVFPKALSKGKRNAVDIISHYNLFDPEKHN